MKNIALLLISAVASVVVLTSCANRSNEASQAQPAPVQHQDYKNER